MADYAIIQTGGNQVKVTEGEKVKLECIQGEPGSEVVFDQVLFVIKGGEARIGTPTVAGATVKAEIIGDGRGKKLRIFKFVRKTGYMKLNGHRQNYTEVKIKSIS
jgi:large subunit ribosomal protein L21